MKCLSIFFYTLMVALCPFFSLSAQVISEEEVIKTALELHPEILGARQKIATAQGERDSAQGGFDPIIRMNSIDFLAGNYDNAGYFDTWLEQATSLYGIKLIAGYRRSQGVLPEYYDQELTQDNGEVRVGVEVPLMRDSAIDSRRAAINKAIIGNVVAETEAEQKEIEIVRLAKEAFYEWVAAGKKHEVLSQLYETASKRQRQLEEREKSGDIAQFDVMDNKKSVLQRQASQLAAKRQFARAQFELSLFLRDAQGVPEIVESGRMPRELPQSRNKSLESFESYFKQAQERRPDLKKIIQLKNQNNIDHALAQNETLPRLDAQMLVSQDFGTQKQRYDDTDYRVGLKFEFPLLNRVAEGKVDALSAKRRELEYIEILLRDKIKSDIQDAISAIEFSNSRIDISSEEYELAKEVQDGELDKFIHGDSNLIFINLREQATADAALRIIDARLDNLKARAALEAIVAWRYVATSPLSGVEEKSLLSQ